MLKLKKIYPKEILPVKAAFLSLIFLGLFSGSFSENCELAPGSSTFYDADVETEAEVYTLTNPRELTAGIFLVKLSNHFRTLPAKGETTPDAQIASLELQEIDKLSSFHFAHFSKTGSRNLFQLLEFFSPTVRQLLSYDIVLSRLATVILLN